MHPLAPKGLIINDGDDESDDTVLMMMVMYIYINLEGRAFTYEDRSQFPIFCKIEDVDR